MAGDKPAGTLLALLFDDPYKADEARAALLRMQGEGLLEIDETAVLARSADGDRLRVSQDTDVVQKDQHIGHVLGIVTAAVTGTMPFILAGTVAGRLVGRLTDHGITDQFVKNVGAALEPGRSALILLARSDPERRRQVVTRLAAFSPTVLESDLPPDVERALIEGLRTTGGGGVVAGGG